MNRRSFLSILGLSAAAIAVDPEMLGWTKTKTIFIPPAPKIRIVACDDTGLSIRVIRQYDLSSNKWITRQDVMLGWWPIQILSKDEFLQRYPSIS